MKWLVIPILALPTILLSFLSPSVSVEQSVRLGEVRPIAQNQKVTIPVRFNVSENKDFYLAIWVRHNKGLRDPIMSKVDFEVKGRPGIMLRFVRDGEDTRPQIYWRNQNRGGWYTFSPIEHITNKWILFLISFRENNLLGLHVAYEREGKTAELVSLGGYKVEIFPLSESLVSVGKVFNPGFRGEIGPVSIFQGGSKRSFDVLKALVEFPGEIPSKEIIFSGTEGIILEKMQND